MVGAVSFSPYVSSYQYTGGYARGRASAQNMQVQAGEGAAAAEPISGRQSGIPAAGRISGYQTGISAAEGASGRQTGSDAGVHAVSAGRSGGVSSLIGARSIAAAGQVSGVAALSAGRAADPESPVQPVDKISAIQPGQSGSVNYMIPFLRKGMDPAELSVRMRMQYAGGTQNSSWTAGGEAAGEKAVQLDLPGTSSEESAAPVQAGVPGASSDASSTSAVSEDAPKIAGMGGAESAQETSGEAECKTCKERKYQDGSDDPGVSFKSPTHIAPDQSASAVRGHEMEHVVRERAKAQSEGRRVVSQSVTMQTGICPECGRVYTAGGVTRTTTAADSSPEEKPKDPRWILAGDI